MTVGASRLSIAVFLDSADEDWRAMDLVGEMLLDQWRAPPFDVDARPVRLPIPRVGRRLPGATDAKIARNVDRALVRYLAYPGAALWIRRRASVFHVVDHTYAAIALALPGARTGIYCHDIDAFRPALEPHRGDRPPPHLRALARVLLIALRSAAVVFHSTRHVARELEAHGIVDVSRLVYAPYGIAPEFLSDHGVGSDIEDVLRPLGGRPFVLHVGTGIPRKRLDVVFEAFARLRAKRPNLRLVQQGAIFDEKTRGLVDRLGVAHALFQPPKLDRRSLAALYRRAAVVLVPSEYEGFGFPVIEALACGAPVVASDLAVLREVGGCFASYVPVGDVAAWTAAAEAVLDGRRPPPDRDALRAHARAFSWQRHAATILEAYRSVLAA